MSYGATTTDDQSNASGWVPRWSLVMMARRATELEGLLREVEAYYCDTDPKFPPSRRAQLWARVHAALSK